MKKQLFLENIRSAHNVGAMFRTADGAGVSKVFLAGYTPAPVDRFGRVQPEIKKTSLGASDYLDWEKVGEDVGFFLTAFKESQKNSDVQIVALEQTPQAIPLKDFTVPENVLYIVGNEVDGVSEAALAACDTVVELPMLGQKESLNVAVAAGILMYHGVA